MDTPATFGEMLKEYRLAAGFTQEALAEQAGVSARNIQNLERGENRPLKDTARRLAEALALEERERALLLTAVTPTPRRRAHALRAGTAPLRADQEAPLPDGMLAVLVADVRGYTAFTHVHGDAAGARLASRFADLAGAAVTAEEGRVVEVRGDEVLAAFGSARAALRAAAGIIARCAEAASPELPLHAGIGLDVGEPVAVAGGYRGEAINTAARLCAQAGPGEALASEALVGLARRVPGLAYEERGALLLKGLSRPVNAWRIRADDAADLPSAPPSVIPAPETAALHNLPIALSSFIGRERERERVCTLLASHRLVTLVGSGGVGKTRLALAVAETLVTVYTDGVWLVELASLADPTLATPAVLQALGLREETGRSPRATIIEHLKPKRALLLLDNCEHLLTACADLVGALLRACPGVHILATSRESLGIAGEQRYRVPSLSVPDQRHLPPPELAGSYEAVRLFVERAAERRDGFTMTPANARAIAAICARVDGVPLAIELAAARAATLSVEAIAARLDERFRLLTGGGRDLPTRQRTLRAALDWSWDLLREEERTLLARLAVFAGGWTLAAAEAVCAGDGLESWAVLDALDALIGKSLVHVDESGEEAGRYRLLETVRQYAAFRLDERGETAAARDRHLAWCIDLAEQTFERLLGPDQGACLAMLETEHDNLRSALGWARASGAVASSVRLAGALWRFWWMHGHLREGRDWLEAAEAGGETSDPGLRGRALNGAGILARYQGAFERATALHEGALALYREVGDPAGIANALSNLGMVAYEQSEYTRAAALHEEALTLRRALGDREGIRISLNNLGMVASERGEYMRAAAMHEEALALGRELGNMTGIAASLGNWGIVAGRQGKFAQAAPLFREALAIHRSLGDRHGAALALHFLGMVAYEHGDYGRAAASHEEALALRRALGDAPGIADSLNGLADAALEQGDKTRARTLLEEALALRRALGDVSGIASTLNGLGDVAFHEGNYAGALAHYEESLALEREREDRWGIAWSLRTLGLVAQRQGDYARALALQREALDLARTLGTQAHLAAGLSQMAATINAIGDPLRAARIGGAGEALRAALEMTPTPAERADQERLRTLLGAALGTETFAAAWAEGRALSVDDAVNMALEETTAL